MGRQIIKQPNGRYAQWSTIVDDFVMVDATPEEIVSDWTEAESRRVREYLQSVFEQLSVGGRPYHQFTMTFDEAIARIREVHGNDRESLRLLGVD